MFNSGFSRSSSEIFKENDIDPLFIGGLQILPQSLVHVIFCFLDVEINFVLQCFDMKSRIKCLYYKKQGKIGLIKPVFSEVKESEVDLIPFAHVEHINLSNVNSVNDSFFQKVFGNLKSNNIYSLKIEKTTMSQFGLLSILTYCKKLIRLTVKINFEINGGLEDQIIERLRLLKYLDLSFEQKTKLNSVLFSIPSFLEKLILRNVILFYDMKNQFPSSTSLISLEVINSKVHLLNFNVMISKMFRIWRKISFIGCIYESSFSKQLVFPPVEYLQLMSLKDVKIINFFSSSRSVFLEGGNLGKTKFPFKNIRNTIISFTLPTDLNVLRFFKYVQRARYLCELELIGVKCPSNILGIKLSKYRFAHRLRKMVFRDMNWVEFDCKLPHVQSLSITGCILRNENIREMLSMNTKSIKYLDIEDNYSVVNKIIYFLNKVKSLRYLNITNTGITDAGIMLFLKENSNVTHFSSDCKRGMDIIRTLQDHNTTLLRWDSSLPELQYDKSKSIQSVKNVLVKQMKVSLRKEKFDGILKKIKLK